MPKIKRYTFVIARKPIERQLSGFLDMLRYDQAQVIEPDTSFVVLQTTNHPPTIGRWHSFALYILAQVEGDYPDIRQLREVAQGSLGYKAAQKM